MLRYRSLKATAWNIRNMKVDHRSSIVYPPSESEQKLNVRSYLLFTRTKKFQIKDMFMGFHVISTEEMKTSP